MTVLRESGVFGASGQGELLVAKEDIENIFSKYISVSPLRHDYRIWVVCDGNVVHEQEVTYKGNIGFGSTVRLGVIT
ncbi:MAG: hypothetical protein GKR91_00045 [Pseudomonadales bacterium]|nr:hypothetical protein [Pseudomonadales bacterium]